MLYLLWKAGGQVGCEWWRLDLRLGLLAGGGSYLERDGFFVDGGWAG